MMHRDHPAPSSAALDAAASAACAEPMAPGLLEGIDALVKDLRRRVRDQLRLAALETRRAGESLVLILAFGIVVGVVLGAAALLAVAAIVVVLIDSGIAAGTALLLTALLLLLVAAGLALVIKRHSRALRFPATLRSLGALDDDGERRS
jgi:uncharacterized membrane protein YqjE